MKTTFKELNEKRTLIITYYGKTDELNSKKTYAIQKWEKQASKCLKEVQDKIAEQFEIGKLDIQVDCAFEKDGILIKNEKGELQYSKEGEKNKNFKLTELSKKLNLECENTEIDFEPYLVDMEVLQETNEFVIEELKNIFIK
jgi:cob(I)alamin adenosyltransferase